MKNVRGAAAALLITTLALAGCTGTPTPEVTTTFDVRVRQATTAHE